MEIRLSIQSLQATLLICLLAWGCTWVPPSGSPVTPSRECQSLDQLLGPSKPEPHMVRPLWRVRACPIQAGAALSGAIETMNSVSDTMDLDRRTWLTHYVIDGRIIAAALDVARNEDSSPEARMYALRTLIWQKAPGHSLAIAGLTEKAPRPGGLPSHTSYTSHYYTDLGYGTGEHPWPVLGNIPDEDYVDEMNRAVSGIRIASDDEPVVNAREWFLWYNQDAQLAELLEEARKGERPGRNDT